MKTPFIPVKSSNIKAIAHDPQTNTLRVEFINSKDPRQPGRVYRFDGVTAEKHQALMNADSIGSHFNAHIKGHHQGTLVNS